MGPRVLWWLGVLVCVFVELTHGPKGIVGAVCVCCCGADPWPQGYGGGYVCVRCAV